MCLAAVACLLLLVDGHMVGDSCLLSGHPGGVQTHSAAVPVQRKDLNFSGQWE